jgi:two-component system cell cycle response regulator DivK
MKKQNTKKRVLVVEDEPEICQLYATLLEGAGFQVDTAEHALSAVCATVRQKPDLILADIRMPIVDGFAFVAELRSHRDTCDIPIIAVTGLDSLEAREAALKAGCNGFMRKPIDPARFAEEIKTFLAPHRARVSRVKSKSRAKAKSRAKSRSSGRRTSRHGRR